MNEFEELQNMIAEKKDKLRNRALHCHHFFDHVESGKDCIHCGLDSVDIEYFRAEETMIKSQECHAFKETGKHIFCISGGKAGMLCGCGYSNNQLLRAATLIMIHDGEDLNGVAKLVQDASLDHAVIDMVRKVYRNENC